MIGRDRRADIVLDHGQVSRRHVYLQVVDGRAFWVDLESRSGSRSAGESQKSGWLDAHRSLGIGPFVIRPFASESWPKADRHEVEPPLAAPLLAVAHVPSQLPDVALEFLNGPSQATAWPVRRVMSLVGSASGCKFRLTDASVSRFHASLVRTPVGLWIVDLLGQGGIRVNDVPRRFSHLVDGDQLQIGRYQIRVMYRTMPRQIADESHGTHGPEAQRSTGPARAGHEWPSGSGSGCQRAAVCGRIAGFETGRISTSHARSARFYGPRSPGVASRVAPVVGNDGTGRIDAGALG